MKSNNLFFAVFLLIFVLTGCGRPAEKQDSRLTGEDLPSYASSPPPALSPTASRASAGWSGNEPDLKDAPALGQQYPHLSGGILTHARLTGLPEGVLLSSGSLRITQKELDDEIARLPAAIREELRKNAYIILEQKAVQKLLINDADMAGITGRDDNEKIQSLIDRITADARVGEQEISAFYDTNREMIGAAALDEIKPRLREYLLQEKKQELIREYVQEAGLRALIAVSGPWLEKQAKAALDNPVDRARAGGKPSLVSFGADACMPCRMMAPHREEIKRKYGEKLNVVYVHVNKEQFLAMRYGVQGIPHIIFFDAAGKEFHAQSGYMSLEQLEEWIKKMGVAL